MAEPSKAYNEIRDALLEIEDFLAESIEVDDGAAVIDEPSSAILDDTDSAITDDEEA